ncbi:MAG: hypothetical protein ACOC5T_03065 [Elusimicrobiota bacterium]
MAYCSVTRVRVILAQALTSSSPESLSQPVDLLKIGNTLDTNQVSISNVEEYIRNADQVIDSSISSLYKTPLIEMGVVESTLYSDIEEYNDYIVTTDPMSLHVGDTIILTDGSHEEKHEIADILDNEYTAFDTVDSIDYEFKAGTRVIVVSYPDPIPLISARIAAGNLYDKYFMSQSDPGKSDYGELMRQLANQSLMEILEGTVVLHGQHRIGGTGFYNPNITREYRKINQPEDKKNTS